MTFFVHCNPAKSVAPASLAGFCKNSSSLLLNQGFFIQPPSAQMLLLFTQRNYKQALDSLILCIQTAPGSGRVWLQESGAWHWALPLQGSEVNSHGPKWAGKGGRWKSSPSLSFSSAFRTLNIVHFFWHPKMDLFLLATSRRAAPASWLIWEENSFLGCSSPVTGLFNLGTGITPPHNTE